MKYPDDYINKVICGDCLEVMRGIPDGVVDLVVTDPPYMFGALSYSGPANKKISGWGDLLNQSYFYREILNEVSRLLKRDAAIWMFSNWRGMPVMFKGVAESRNYIESMLVWDKQWIGPGGPVGLRPSYELVLLIPRGKWVLPNRGLPDIWRHKWAAFMPNHPAEKP